MTRRDASDDTPSLDEVEQDFSTPGDADLGVLPGHDDVTGDDRTNGEQA